MRRVLKTKLGNNVVETRARAALAGPRALVCILVAGSLVLAACGGGGGDDDTSAGTEDIFAPEASGETENAEGTVEPATFTVGASVRYAGFVFQLGDGELGPSEDFDGNPDPSMGRLTIETQIENLGPDTSQPGPELHFEREGAALDVGDFSLSELPDVPGEAKSNGTIVADGLPADFTLEGVVLVFGSNAVHPSSVPLDGNAPVVSAEPLAITPGEPGKVGEVTVTITGGELRYDSVTGHEQYEADKAGMYIEFDMTGSAALNGYSSVNWLNLELGLPDGTRTAAEDASWEDIKPSETLRDLWAFFQVPADVRGSFELVLTGDYGTTYPGEEVGGFAPFELTDSVEATDSSEAPD